MRVVAWIEDAFGVQLPLRTLFEMPTLAQLAERIDQAAAPPLQDPEGSALVHRSGGAGVLLS